MSEYASHVAAASPLPLALKLRVLASTLDHSRKGLPSKSCKARITGWNCRKTAQPIDYKDGQFAVPDHPIIPFIEGDGTGRDIWKASQRVFDAAVEKAYGGKRAIRWFEIFAGEKAYPPVQHLAARRLRGRRARSARLHQGTAHHAGRRRHSLAQRGAAPDSRPLRLRAAGEVLPGRAQPGEAPGKGRHRHLPREHRGCVRGHRVQSRAQRTRRG